MASNSTASGLGAIPTTPEGLLTQFGGVLLDLGIFIVSFGLVYILGKHVVVNLAGEWLNRKGFDETIHSLGEKVAKVGVFFLAMVVAFTAAGFPSFLTAFATLGGALALAVGFASQDLLSNFVAGLFILKDKPFEIGDWIQWNDGEGTVQEIDLRVTRVKTFDNELITVPNSDLANSALKNPVAYEKLRQKFLFGIGYDSDIGKATEIILEEANAHEGIMEDPGPSVRLTELGDSAVGLQARIWIEKPSRSDFVKTKSEFVQAVKQRFDEEDIDIPYPNRTLSGSLKLEE